MSSFIPTLAICDIDLANRLDVFQKSYEALQYRDTAAFEATEEDNLALGAIQANNVIDNEPMSTRSGLMIFLEALVRECDHTWLQVLTFAAQWLSFCTGPPDRGIFANQKQGEELTQIAGYE